MTDTAPESRRFTVSLTPKSVAALDHLMLLDGLSQTDIINRAVQVYDFIAEHRSRGIKLLFEHPDSTTETVHII